MAGNAMNENRPGNDERHGADAQPTSPPANASNSPAADEGSASVGQHPGFPTSERKKEANRENAKKSTGPKTEGGKRTVRLNALHHGFYATDAVIGQKDGWWEDEEEFTTLHCCLN